MSASFPLNVNGILYRARRAVIERSHFGVSDHGGVLTIDLTLSYPDGGTGITVFGGYALDGRNPGGGARVSTAYGMDFAVQVMAAAGADSWEAVQGSECLALFPAAASTEDGQDFWGLRPLGIADRNGTNTFIAADHAALWAETQEPVPAAGEAITDGERLCALRTGSMLRFTALDGTAGVAIRREDGWSATGLLDGMDDHLLWAKTTAVAYLGNAGDDA